MPSIRERAADAVKRAEAAGQGPWSYDTFGTSAVVLSGACAIVAETEAPDCSEDEGRDKVRAIAGFIAEARADVPDFAAALLRVTGPEMRARLVEWTHSEQHADALLALILSTAEGQP